MRLLFSAGLMMRVNNQLPENLLADAVRQTEGQISDSKSQHKANVNIATAHMTQPLPTDL